MMNRPRVGLLVPFVPYYEPIISLREEKARFAEEIRRRLEADFDVISAGLVEEEYSARRVGESFLRERVDAVVVAPSLAVFGALAWAALENNHLPVCIWNVQPSSGMPPGYDIRQLIRHSGGLGTMALANTLARTGRPFRVGIGAGDGPFPRELMQFVRACAAAAAVRGAVFGRVGGVFPEMTDVLMDSQAWTAATGSRVVEIPAVEFTARFRQVGEDNAGTHLTQIHSCFEVSDISEDELNRSSRIAAALDRIVEEYGLAGGAFNCHGENCLGNPEIGVTGCYAVSKQTSEGKPFSCTGDLPTAIAMFMLNKLAGCVIYGELDFVDFAGNYVLLANGGEGDVRAARGPVRIVGNENFAGRHGHGASLRFQVAPGPATLLSLTPLQPAPRYRMVIGAGTLMEQPETALGLFHGAFRFCGVQAAEAFRAWCEAGATHHLALAPGDWSSELTSLAEILKFEAVKVGDKHEAGE